MVKWQLNFGLRGFFSTLYLRYYFMLKMVEKISWGCYQASFLMTIPLKAITQTGSLHMKPEKIFMDSCDSSHTESTENDKINRNKTVFLVVGSIVIRSVAACEQANRKMLKCRIISLSFC